MAVTIRHAQHQDVPAITDIYNQAVALKTATADLEPMTIDYYIEWLARHVPGRYPVFIAEVDGEVAGWCSLNAYREGRQAFRHTGEISFYIDEKYWGQGLATQLTEHMLKVAPELGYKNIFAMILEVNETSIHLVKKFGFEQWGCLPNIADFDGNECSQLYYGKRLD